MGEIPHGIKGYVENGCRCKTCQDAWDRTNVTRFPTQEPLSRADDTNEPVQHGIKGYIERGCRCKTCQDAWDRTMVPIGPGDPQRTRILLEGISASSVRSEHSSGGRGRGYGRGGHGRGPTLKQTINKIKRSSRRFR